MLTDVDDRGGGRRRITNTPYRFSAAEAGVRRPAAYRGEHNYEALADWLGSSEADIDGWHRDGILLQDDNATQLRAAADSAAPLAYLTKRRSARCRIRLRTCTDDAGGGAPYRR